MKLNTNVFYGIGAVALFLIIGVITVHWLTTRLPASVKSYPTCLSIANTSDEDWKNVKLTLNENYRCVYHDSAQQFTIRAHETNLLVYSYFLSPDGIIFNPSVPATKLHIEANDGTAHPLLGDIAIQRADNK